MSPTPTSVDIVIIGGGIAGLWLLNRLCNQGYNAVLFEQAGLGCKQTLASQGMIHGGVKYALGGALTGSSEAIADMPAHWRRCLKGEGDVDLRKATILSDHFYMWSTRSITSRLTSFVGTKIGRGRVEDVKKTERPEVFANDTFDGKLYRLVDLVLDVPSLVQALADNYKDRIFAIDWEHSQFQQASDGSIQQLVVGNEKNSLSISAQRFVLTAGEGNEQLLSTLNASKPLMQRRPLRQVMVKHRLPYHLYAHCMGSNPTPRLTISSHPAQDGSTIWYLGGDLATSGVALSDQQVIKKAQSELKDLFPWLDFSDAQWSTLYVERAEPKQKGLIKPDKAFVRNAAGCANVIVGWPTKLTLAPAMADDVCALLKEQAIEASSNSNTHDKLDDCFSRLDKPVVGTPYWEKKFESN